MMERDWIHETEILIRLLDRASEAHPDRFSCGSFLSMIRYVCPEIERQDEKAALFAADKGAFARFLLEIPATSRARIYGQFARDVFHLFPVAAQHLLDELEHFGEAPPPNYSDKIDRYHTWIDGAILAGRYTLALHLTHRLLRENFRAFLRARAPVESDNGDLRLLSVLVCRYAVQYFRKHTIPYSERRVMLIATVSDAIAAAVRRLNRSSGKSFIDKALAIYARDNVRRIIRFLSKMK